MANLFKRADGQRWQKNHISPSKLNLWSQCSAAFWFRYVLGIKKPGKVWLPQGTAVHAGVEHLLNDLSQGITREKEYYQLMAEMAWDEQVEKSQRYRLQQERTGDGRGRKGKCARRSEALV